MFTKKDQKKLRKQVAEYDIVETEENIPEPVRRPLVKIQKSAVIFTVADIYKYKAECNKLIAESEGIIKQIEKTKAEQLERLEKYNDKFGINCVFVFSGDDFSQIKDLLTPENFAELIEANDLVRYLKWFEQNIKNHQDTILHYKAEVERYDEELETINKQLGIGTQQLAYEAEQIVKNSQPNK